jgi:hypothetical protein
MPGIPVTPVTTPQILKPPLGIRHQAIVARLRPANGNGPTLNEAMPA